MKRPLFCACICLVAAAAVRLRLGEAGDFWQTVPCDGSGLIVTGRVYQKDNDSFYLDSIDSVYLNESADNLQQTISEIDFQNNNLICEYDEASGIRLGSRVRVEGLYFSFDEATNPGEFDASEYYQRLNIIGKLKNTRLLACSVGYSVWQEGIYQLREYFKERLYKVFPDKEASIMTAMLLGDKSDLDRELKQLYQRSGIVHILSISGLHITLIGMSIYRLLRKCKLKVFPAACIGSCILLFYGVLTGMSISACRAIGMYLLSMLSLIMGRTYDMLTAVGVMGAVLTLWKPEYLYNAGFLLSFGAVLGIGLIVPPLERVFGRKQSGKGKTGQLISSLGQSVITTISVSLATLPIQLWFYYELPVYSLFLNLLVLPPMRIVMTAGLLVMLIPGSGIAGTPVMLILKCYEGLCRFFEGLPFAMWTPGQPKLWQAAVYYLLLAVGIYRLKGTKNENGVRRRQKLFSAGCLLLGVYLLGGKFFLKTRIYFLDVGQGDCICVQTASGEVYLFDCGSSSRTGVGEYVLKPFLKKGGNSRITAVFVSHPDTDHCSGVLELLAKGSEWGISADTLVLPDIAEELCASELTELIKSAAKSGTQVMYVKAGDYWESEKISCLCLHPPKGSVLETNAYSQCFYVSFKENGLTMLLTGDVEGEGEELLVRELKQQEIEEVFLLKVAHHGSKNSSTQKLLNQISPRLSVISCGAENSYGHPHKEAVERIEKTGSLLLTTAEYGAIEVEIAEGKETEVYGFKK